MNSKPKQCPHCGQYTFYDHQFGNAFICTHCGVKAIREGYYWYYEEHHLSDFNRLKRKYGYGSWFKKMEEKK